LAVVGTGGKRKNAGYTLSFLLAGKPKTTFFQADLTGFCISQSEYKLSYLHLYKMVGVYFGMINMRCSFSFVFLSGASSLLLNREIG
jgi:hypothetical protein